MNHYRLRASKGLRRGTHGSACAGIRRTADQA